MSDDATNPLAEDLDSILTRTRELWEELRGQRIFITGGTGFFGCWLLESLLWANDRLGLNATAVVLTRDGEAFRKKVPHIVAHPAIRLLVGDVRSFTFPSETFSHVIHAATDARYPVNVVESGEMLDTILQGTRHVLDFAAARGVRKVLFISSGAVYGRQPPELMNLPEDYAGAPDVNDPISAYGEGKRMAELLCAHVHQDRGIETKIARCFAFVGPHLPLDAHFAIGNFIRDALRGGPIQVQGDGTAYRSYAYASDLVVWLWTILFRGRSCRPYNVGSEVAFTIADVANMVADSFETEIQVQIAKQRVPGQPAERYVPSVARATSELGLRQEVDLCESIRRTVLWHTRHSRE